MRTRWMLAASILVLLTLLPGTLPAANAPGGAPAQPAVAVAAAASAMASAPAPVAPALPVWASLPAQASAETLPATDRAPLFLTTCSGCTGSACTRLHSCVLLHCC